MDKRFKYFFSSLFFTTLLPYLPFILPFLPEQLFGFNWTGWAWIIMLFVSFGYLISIRKVTFPILGWLPWIFYLTFYLVYDFSFLGLQLTLQYILPLLVGIIVSSFHYTEKKLRWLFLWFIRLTSFVSGLFWISYLFRGESGPAVAAAPMFLSIAASLFIGIYYITKQKKYIAYFGLLFLVPFLLVTRMGLAAFLVIFIFHFANRKIWNKLLYGLVGFVFVILVFNSHGFQQKTFQGGHGSLNELSLNYYDNSSINDNGRTTIERLLLPGLKKSPLLGNGPRADLLALKPYTRLKEAHNDYLSVEYNYGFIGLILLLFGFVINFLRLYQILKRTTYAFSFLLGTSVLILFVSFLIFMYSDNILKYTIYFPNYFFAMIGIFFSFSKNLYKREITPKSMGSTYKSKSGNNYGHINHHTTL